MASKRSRSHFIEVDDSRRLLVACGVVVLFGSGVAIGWVAGSRFPDPLEAHYDRSGPALPRSVVSVDAPIPSEAYSFYGAFDSAEGAPMPVAVLPEPEPTVPLQPIQAVEEPPAEAQVLPPSSPALAPLEPPAPSPSAAQREARSREDADQIRHVLASQGDTVVRARTSQRVREEGQTGSTPSVPPTRVSLSAAEADDEPRRVVLEAGEATEVRRVSRGSGPRRVVTQEASVPVAPPAARAPDDGTTVVLSHVSSAADAERARSALRSAGLQGAVREVSEGRWQVSLRTQGDSEDRERQVRRARSVLSAP
jgi:hypothetical protein